MMETRSRARDPPDLVPNPKQLPATRRITRQTAKQDISPAVSKSPKAEYMDARGSLAADPVARRGARLHGPAPSVNSIATQPQEAADASDDGEDEATERNAREEFLKEGHGEPDKSEAPDDQEAAVQRQVMAFGLIDLAKVTVELFRRLQKPDYENMMFRGILKMKRITFYAVRGSYESSSFFPFVEWDWLDSLGKHTAETIRTAKTVLISANLATALDLSERIKLDADFDPLPFLERLDAVFPTLFAQPNHKEQYVDLALEIRTLRLIETLAATKSDTHPREVVAVVFCEPTSKKSWTDLFTKGPYRSLAELTDEPLIDICSERIKRLFMIMMTPNNQIKSPLPISELRETFPLRDLLARLSELFLSFYSVSASRLEHAQYHLRLLQLGNAYLEADAYHDTDEDMDDCVSCPVTESQRIERITGTGNFSSRTLFQNKDSIRQLHSGPTLAQKFPSQTPESRVSRASQDDQSDDDDDEYEQDRRPVDNSKRAALSASRSAAKRRAVVHSPSARTDMPPPSVPNCAVSSSSPSSSAPPQSSQLYISTIKRRKTLARQNAQAQFNSYQQRFPWSTRDYEVLIRLIEHRSAAWSVIEKKDGHLFERSRNQQAYRDKARNMKVDFLIADSILPPCFDLVTLGKKEIKRLQRMGKNPARMEKDVDDDGRPTNTELPMQDETSDD